MIEEQAREDIAFIRRAIEEGGAYATARSADMLVWGVAVALGYLGTYGFIRGWSPLAPNALWAACIGLPWLYSLRRQLGRLLGGAPSTRGPMAQALSMLWLGCGVLLTTLAIAVCWGGEIRQGWFDAVAAGVLGTAFFASSCSPTCRGCAGWRSPGGSANWPSLPRGITRRRCCWRAR